MRVITYANPRELAGHSDWSLMQSAPHICATNALAQGLAQAYGPGKGDLVTVSVIRFFKRLLPLWTAQSAQLDQYVQLTGILDSLRELRPEWGERLRAFRRNQQDLLKGIRTLAEGGLTPSDLSPAGEDEVIFQEVWRRLEGQDFVLQSLRRDLFGRFETTAVFMPQLAAALPQGRQKGKPAGGVRRVMLHGFDFFTPLQMRLIRLAEMTGVEVILLNCADPRFTAPSASRVDDLMAELCTGRAGPAKASPQILRYTDTAAFLRAVADNLALPEAERAVFCSPAAEELNALLRQYYPEFYPERHFLSYPIGQFLYQLHTMFSEEQNRLVLTAGGAMACFQSGLLRTNSAGREVEGRKLTLALRRALPYFRGCEGLDEWVQRARQLHQELMATVAAWDPQTPAPGRTTRFRRILENPARGLSYFQVTLADAEDIAVLLEHLRHLGESVCQGEKRVTLGQHLASLRAMLFRGGADGGLVAEEKQLLTELMARLADGEQEGLELPAKDLAAAIALFLGSLDDSEDRPLIRPFTDVSGLVLDDRPLHLCMLNEGLLPRRQRAIPWPLNAGSFQACAQTDAVRSLIVREETGAGVALAQFYGGLAYAPDVTLSWVAEWDGVKQQESIYLLLLKEGGADESPGRGTDWAPGAPREPVHVQGQAAGWPDEFPIHAGAEFEACPRRFYYSYVVSERPVFESDFHLEFLYGRLLSWYAERFGTTAAKARQAVDRLFPGWGDVRLRDLSERWGHPMRGRDMYAGREYGEVLRWLLLPAHTTVRRVERFFETEAGAWQGGATLGQGQELLLQMEPKPSVGCRFCPHIDWCADARFPVDD